jgi:hypothetical protein
MQQNDRYHSPMFADISRVSDAAILQSHDKGFPRVNWDIRLLDRNIPMVHKA